jgi:hypothetical protein
VGVSLLRMFFTVPVLVSVPTTISNDVQKAISSVVTKLTRLHGILNAITDSEFGHFVEEFRSWLMTCGLRVVLGVWREFFELVDWLSGGEMASF